MIPSDIAGLAAWYKADAITGLNDGDTVTQWDDSSGNARHLANAGAPNYQTGEVNSLPVVRFDGVDDSLSHVAGADYITGTTATALAVVRRQAGGAANDRSMAFTSMDGGADFDTARAFMAYEGAANDRYATMRLSAERALQNPHPANLTLFLATIWYDGANGNMRINGAAASTPSSASVGSFSIGRVTLGAGFAGGAIASWAQYDFAEVCLYDNDIGAQGRTDVEGYLMAKWLMPGVQKTFNAIPLMR